MTVAPHQPSRETSTVEAQRATRARREAVAAPKRYRFVTSRHLPHYAR
ncbi:hypothetical protein [Streptomyces abikoensis]